MNKIYRSIWNELTGTFVAVAETAKAHGKRVGSHVAGALGALFGLQPLALALMAAGLAHAAPPVPTQLPTYGTVVAGQASISQSNSVMTVNQGSNRAVVDWGSFNIGSSATVNFVQPSSSSAILNRVLDANPSQILGNINANGQVFLTNASGIYFGQNATINVGALTATTHSIGNADFMAGNLRFSRDGATGSVVNDATINAALGGYIALLAPEVRNNGVVVAQMGTVALAAGEAYELQFDGARLASVRVEPATIAALVENNQAVHAPGGLIILSAQAANRLQGGVVNNSGSLEATGLVDNGGTIRLSASDKISHSGSIKADAAANSAGKGGSVSLIADLANANSVTEVNGSISARGGDQGGNGGFVETSAGRVQIGGSTLVDTRAPQGKTGEWLLDPTDYTVAAAGGDRTGWSLTEGLQSSDVTISVTNNIYINDAVWWNANKLSLSAGNDVNVNSLMTMAGASTLAITTGASGKLNMGFDTGGTFKGRIELPGRSGTYVPNTPQNATNAILRINGEDYTVINNLGASGSTTGTDLQGINGNLSGKFALGSDIDASATSGWSSAAGFAPIGDSTTKFTGVLDGLGHSIKGLTINRPSTNYVGLIGFSDNGVLRNVGVTGASVTGQGYAGTLAGAVKGGIVHNSYATGSVTGASGYGFAGGLIGETLGAVVLSRVHANTNVYVPGWSYNVGGLVGGTDQFTAGTLNLDSAYASGSVSGNYGVGGLIGFAFDTTVTNAYATGAVGGLSDNPAGIGGLVGRVFTNASVRNAYATGSVSAVVASGYGGNLGGFVGTNQGTISNAYSTGSVSVSGTYGKFIGGFAGRNQGSISNVFSAGNVPGSPNLFTGALIGYNTGVLASATDSYATGTVNGLTAASGNLIGTGNGTKSGLVAGAPTLTTNTLNVSGSWTTDANWSLGHAPTVLEKADIGTNTVSIPQVVIAGDVTAGTGSKINFTGNLVSSLNVGQNGAVTLGASASDVTVDYGTSGKINLPAASSLVLNGASYTVINSLGSAGSTTGTDLQGMNGNLAGAYVLGMDVDASDTAAWNSGKGFVPIAPTTAAIRNNIAGQFTGAFNGTPFSGTLNGLGHSVINLKINDLTLSNVGLLGYVVGSGGVSNVGVVDASISAKSRVGGLIGSVQGDGSGTTVQLTNLWASGSVAATKLTKYNYQSFTDVGGLIGSAFDANLSNVHADVAVSGQDADIGGLIGSLQTNSTLNTAYATGNVTGYTAVGGVVGFLADNFGANHVYATGTVTGTGGNSALGGLVGSDRFSTINYGTATGTVTGETNVGGLIGVLRGGATDGAPSIQNVRASGDVSASGSFVGGLIGAMQGSGIATARATGNVSSTYGSAAYGSIGGLVGSLSYSAYGIYDCLAFGNVSAPNASKVGGLVGDGSDSYILGNARGNVTGLNHVGGLIGYLAGGGSSGSSIQGSTGYVVVIGNDNVGGLIGTVTGGSNAITYVGNGSTSNATVSGHSNVGGLIGQVSSGSYGVSVSKSYTLPDQTVTATGDNVGGLIGLVGNQAVIDQVYASGTVNGNASTSHYVGGLIGHWQGNGTSPNTLTNAYADGAVTGADKVGGLIGEIDVNNAAGTATVTHVYARGAVTSSGTTGGLLASKTGAGTVTITDAYWDTQTTGQATSADGAGKATTAMQAKATYANFDFTSGTGIWRILSGANSSYPQLCFFAGSCNSDNGSGVAVTTVSAYLRLVAGSSVYGDTPILSYKFYTSATGGTEITDANASGSVVWSTPLSATSNANTYGESYTSGITLGNSAYALSAGNAVNWVINPRPLNVTVSKIYDGNANYSAGFVFSGMVNGNAAPTVSSGSAAVSGKNVGNYTGFSSSALVLSDTNYTVVGGAVSADITAKPLTVSAPSLTKTYDGNTSATGSANVGALGSGDSVSTAATMVFTDKNYGVGNKTVQVSGVTIKDSSNADMTGNYDITYIGNTTSTINKASLTVSGTTAAGKTYDGTTTAVLSGGSLQGVIGSETVTLTQAGTFADKNVGTGKTVTAVDTLGGADAGNYALTQPTGLSADIAAKALTVNGTAVASKVYDGTTTATLSGGALVGVVGSETVTLTQAGTFANKNVGTGIVVTAADSLGGADASNYTLNQPTSLSADIAAKALTVSGTTVASKTYDGTTTAALSGGALVGVVGSEVVTLSQAGTFASKNVGTAKAVAAADSISGADAGNYTLTQPAGLSADISAKTLTVSGTTAAGKTYDGTTTAVLSGGSLQGVIGSETVTLTQAGTFADKNVGTGKTVTAVDTLGGADAGNYALTQPTGLSADITAKSIQIAGLTAQDKVFDGTVAVTISDWGIPSGLVGSETLALVHGAASFTDASVGLAKSVVATGYSVADGSNGGLASNYRLLSDVATATASITAAPVTPPLAPVASTQLPVQGQGLQVASSAPPAGASTSNAGTNADRFSGVTVSLERGTNVQQAPVVTVAVPKELATSGAGFSFPLPEQVANVAGGAASITAELPNGSPLPAWLKFNPESKVFTGSAVPDGAFPLQLVVINGTERTIVVISEKAQ